MSAEAMIARGAGLGYGDWVRREFRARANVALYGQAHYGPRSRWQSGSWQFGRYAN